MAQPRDHAYFDGSDERYLKVMRSAEDKFIGKIIDGGTPASAMDDVRRNVISLMNKFAQGRYKEDDVKVFALDEGDPPPEEVEEPTGDEANEPPTRGGYY
jgi:hypothetical protein